MKLLTATQMREVDRTTIEECGIPGPVLMHEAAQAVVRLLQQQYGAALRGRVGILCGRGNNGGDGMVVARLLHGLGVAVRLVLLGDPAGIHGDAALAWNSVQAIQQSQHPDFDLHIVADESAWPAAFDTLKRCSLLVDAVLGTGIRSAVRGLTRQALLDMIQRRAQDRDAIPVVAIDMPSGLASDAGESEEDDCILQADWTVTFTAPKLGQFLSPHADRIGRLRVEAIGTPARVLARPGFTVELTTGITCQPFLQPRLSDSHKGGFGHVLVLGGSVGKSGAAALAGTAALRVGAGLVTVAAPASVLPLIAGYRPELMTEPLPETPQGTLALSGLEQGRIGELLATRTVLAMGPGVSQIAETAELVRRLVAQTDRPLVLDADGLNAFAGHRDQLRAAGAVLTPHPGEMSRLFGVSTAEVQAHRRSYAQRLAQETGAIVVLKGHRTLVAGPDGRLFVNTTGNPGMATGGTGDVLTGMVAGLIAQFPRHDRLQAVAAAVYLHGLAGDEAALIRGEMGLLAGDLIECLPRAMARATADKVELPRQWAAVRGAMRASHPKA